MIIRLSLVFLMGSVIMINISFMPDYGFSLMIPIPIFIISAACVSSAVLVDSIIDDIVDRLKGGEK